MTEEQAQKKAARNKAYYAAHRDDLLVRSRINAKENAGRRSAYYREYNHGMAASEYDALFNAQNKVCAICGNPPGKKGLHIDHNHKTGANRALLCHKCNAAIGFANEDIHTLFAMAMYLNRWEYEII